METFRDRVVTEKKELDAKLDKLKKFVAGDQFKTLPTADTTLLNKQVVAMKAYSEVLSDRLALTNSVVEEI